MKKIIPALCLLLISVMVLGTSTFAWFSMNTQVSATEMQVTVYVPSSLSISVTNEDEGFGARATLTNDSSMGTTIVPTTYAATPNASNERDFFKLTPDAMATVNENGVLGTIVGSSDSAEIIADSDYYEATTADYFKDTMWIRYDSEKNTQVDLLVKVEWDDTDVDDVIKSALHVLFIDANGAVLADYDMSSSPTGQPLNITLISGATKGTMVTAYCYLAGPDEECKNSAISVNDTLKVKITFFGEDE